MAGAGERSEEHGRKGGGAWSERCGQQKKVVAGKGLTAKCKVSNQRTVKRRKWRRIYKYVVEKRYESFFFFF